jgi:hypothetical protein
MHCNCRIIRRQKQVRLLLIKMYNLSGNVSNFILLLLHVAGNISGEIYLTS